MGNPQCTRCIHKEMCKWVDTIAELKTRYPFINTITCSYAQRPGQAAKAPVQEAAEPDEDPEARTTNEVLIEEPAEPMAPSVEQAEPPADCSNIMQVRVEALPLTDSTIAEALRRKNINNVQDIYDYDASKKSWRGIFGMTEKKLRALSDVLTSLNLQALSWH